MIFWMVLILLLSPIAAMAERVEASEVTPEIISQEHEKIKQREMIKQQMGFLAGSLGSMPSVPELDKTIQLPMVLEEDSFYDEDWDV